MASLQLAIGLAHDQSAHTLEIVSLGLPKRWRSGTVDPDFSSCDAEAAPSSRSAPHATRRRGCWGALDSRVVFVE